MASAQQYLEFRDECLRWAQAARTDAEREVYLELAKTWHEAALRVERSLGLIAQSNVLLEPFEK